MLAKKSKILVPVGLSDQAFIALRQAVNLAKKIQGEITVLSVLDNSSNIYKLMDSDSNFDTNVKDTLQVKLKSLISNYEKELGNSIDILVNKGKVYKLNAKDQTFLCPLWHHELCFDESGNDLIIKMIPDLDDHIQIDEKNNITIKIKENLPKVFQNHLLEFNVGEKKLSIAAAYLRITKYQTYILKNVGIFSINEQNIYDISHRSNILVEIHLHI